jgi:SAM-dependent methyltransferase
MDRKQKLALAIRSQFMRPRNFAGWLVGWEMALRSSNRKRNAWAVELLGVEPTDRVLEIGFGPGIAIRELSHRATRGLVCGGDHSEVMVRQSGRREGAIGTPYARAAWICAALRPSTFLRSRSRSTRSLR